MTPPPCHPELVEGWAQRNPPQKKEPAGAGSAWSPPPLFLLGDFEEAGGAHAAADAHRDADVFHVAAFAFDERVHHHARTRDAVGMADRDRAAIDVETILRVR